MKNAARLWLWTTQKKIVTITLEFFFGVAWEKFGQKVRKILLLKRRRRFLANKNLLKRRQTKRFREIF